MCIHHYNTYITFCRNPSRARAGPTDVHYSKTTTTNNNNILWPRQLVWSSGVEGWNIFSSKLLWKSCRPDRRTGRPRNVSGRLETLQRLRSGFRVGTCLFSYNILCIIINAEILRAKCFAKPVSYPSYLPNIRSRNGGQKVRTFLLLFELMRTSEWRRLDVVIILSSCCDCIVMRNSVCLYTDRAAGMQHIAECEYVKGYNIVLYYYVFNWKRKTRIIFYAVSI